MSKNLILSNGNYKIKLVIPVYIPTFNGLVSGWKTKLILNESKEVGSMIFTNSELKKFNF